MLCFRTNSCVSSFFSQNPGRSWRPPWCSRKEGLRLLKPRPFSPSPRPLLHRRTPPARFHSNHNETMRLLGDPPPPSSGLTVGGVVVLSTSFFYFFFLDKFTPFIPLFLPLHRELLQSLDCFKKLNDKNHSRGGKSPNEAKGTRFGNLFGLPVGATDRSDWMKFTSRLVERSDGEMLMMKRLHVLIYGRKKKRD